MFQQYFRFEDNGLINPLYDRLSAYFADYCAQVTWSQKKPIGVETYGVFMFSMFVYQGDETTEDIFLTREVVRRDNLFLLVCIPYIL